VALVIKKLATNSRIITTHYGELCFILREKPIQDLQTKYLKL